MNEWINIEDKKPVEGQEVFATGLDYNKGPDRHYARCKYNGGGFYEMVGDDSHEYLEYITHWMPCEPPK